MRVWIFQKKRQREELGEEQAPWQCGWYDPQGRQRSKSCGSGLQGRRNAEKLKRRIEGELAAGTYQTNCRKTWEEFWKEFQQQVLAGKRAGTRRSYEDCLANFKRLAKPNRMQAITTKVVAEFVSARRKEDGLKADTKVSKATINKELRHLRAVLRKAHKWGYLPAVPEFDFEREPKKLPTFVPDEDFVAMYQSCDAAREPKNLANGVTAETWWRALLVMAFMTGWRIGSLLAIRWKDVDLDVATALSLADDNKGDRDQLVPVHAAVVQHLRPLKETFDAVVFPWNRSRRSLYQEFHRIQDAAKVKPARKEYYGFHDLRRGFATYNADRMTPDALQALMAHKDYQTTQRYINMARQLKPAVADIFVPSALKDGTPA